MNFLGKLILILAASLFLTACHTVHPRNKIAADEIHDTLQAGIESNRTLLPANSKHWRKTMNAALLPSLSHYLVSKKETPPRFDIAANNIPAKDFYMSLVAGTSYNMLVHPNVRGTISIKLKNVSVKQVMDAVRDLYGYEYRRTSYGFEVLPAELESKIFNVNFLDLERIGKSVTQITSGQISNKVGTVVLGQSSNTNALNVSGDAAATTSSIETRSKMHFWQDLERTIEGMLGKGDGQSVTVNSQAGIVVVRAFPGELHQVSRYITRLQSNLERQVIIEAKILEVQLNDAFQSGIDWGVIANPADRSVNHSGIGQFSDKTFPGTTLDALSGIFAIRVKGKFSTFINLLQTQGNVQVLSSPHIATINNQKAVIKVGQDEFFVTGVSTSNTIVGTSTIPSQDVSLTPFFSGITLDVTPEISRDNTIILHIHPSVSKVTEQQKQIVLGSTTTGVKNTLELPLAKSTIRESDNIVRAKNGQVVVIGGLMENNMKETIAGTPGLSKVPFLGGLFRRTQQESNKTELVILLRPMIASNRKWVDQLEDKKASFQRIRRPFHMGGLPRVFGNEGERSDD